MKKLIIAIVLTALVTSALVSARYYHGADAYGVAWNWGGVEVLPKPALFVCPGNYDFPTDTFTPNPIAPYFPELLTDC